MTTKIKYIFINGDVLEVEALSKTLEGLTSTQKRRLILQLLGISYREIASQEKVNVKSVFESIEGIRKKLQEIRNYTIDE